MTNELRRFAETFKTEDELRKHIATLLTKMRTQGVQITHGAQELGKDIIFYAPDAFNNWVLHACVIKNTKITGSVDDNDGARNVLFQVEQALDTPFIGPAGGDEHVSRVYVISPYDCSQVTMRSVQGKLLKRHGQIEFLCGGRLLEKFSSFWPEFLFFESTLLGSYVATLQKSFDQMDPIRFLASQHSIFSDAGITWRNVYVRQTFGISLLRYEFLVDVPDSAALDVAMDQSRLMHFIEQLRFASQFVKEPQAWESGDRQSAYELATSIELKISEIKSGWEHAWQQYRDDTEKEGRTALARSIARVKVIDVDLKAFQDVLSRTEDVVISFRRAMKRANTLVDSAQGKTIDLGSSEYLNYCRIREVIKLLPSAFRQSGKPIHNKFSEDLLNLTNVPLLVTGPAGYGKTSFCKWNVLNDVKGLVEKSSSTIPVYVPLHQLATAQVKSGEDAFFRTSELQEIMETARKSRQKLRLYLDGLDEVTTVEHQELLLNLAAQLKQGWPAIQIVVTGRDYVSGPWLRWLPRVNLSELGEKQVEELVLKWLDGNRELVDEFQNQLLRVPTLKPLMHIPLLGTLIIAVFKKLKSLPEGRAKLYEIFVELMCGGWDIAKNVKRETRFGSRGKLSVLTRLAGILHLNGKREAQESDVRTAVSQTVPALLEQWRNILDEILEDGLLIRIGKNLAFSHLSFQEYLVATDLSDPTGNRQQHVLRSFLTGEDWWREVLSFFMGMSTRPDETETWIRRTLEKLTHRTYDLPHRFDFLILRLKEAWPGWNPRHAAPKW